MANVQLKLCTMFFILSIILCLELKSEKDPREPENTNDISLAIPTFDPRNQSHTQKEQSEQTDRELSIMESGLRRKKDVSDELSQRGGQRVKKSTHGFHNEKLLEKKRETGETKILKSGRRKKTKASEEFENFELNNSQEISNDSIQFPDSERLMKIEGNEIQNRSSFQINKSLLCTASSGLDINLVKVVTDVIRTITVTHLYLVFQSETSDCLLQSLWQQDVAMEVMRASHWWSRVSRLTYRSYSQHVLVGSVDWIAAVMNKVKLFYDNSSINALHTKWIWVALDPSSKNSTLLTGPLPPSVNTATTIGSVSESLQEGMRGVLIFRERKANSTRLSEKSQLFSDGRPIKVAAVEASGDGSWNLGVAGVWRFGILQKFNALWPEPAFNFNNRTVRISCINKPMVFEYQDGLGLEAATGYLSDVMRIVQMRLNFSDVLLPTVGFGTPEPNGSWNGMVGVLQRKEADMSPLDFSPSFARSQVVEFSIPVSEDVLIIVSKAPSVLIKPFLILQIFSPFAWASIVGGAFFIEIAVEFMLRVESGFGPSQKERSIITHTLGNILKAFVGQTCEQSPPGNGTRIAVTSGFIVALILGSLYKGFITAFLAIPFRSTPINSAEDLMDSKTRPALRERTQFVETLVMAEYGILHPARDKVGLFSESHISSSEFFEEVADGTYALADSYSSAIGRAKKFERRGTRCRFYKGKVPLRTDMDVFAFSQNSPFLHPFDDTIKWLKFFGIIDYFRNKYYALPCKAEVSSNDPQPMTLNQMQGCLYVLGIGLALGTAAFVFESVWPKGRKPGFSSSESHSLAC